MPLVRGGGGEEGAEPLQPRRSRRYRAGRPAVHRDWQAWGPLPTTTSPPPTPPPAGRSLPGPQDSGGVGASGAAVPGAEGSRAPPVPAELPAPAVVRAAGGRAALSAAVSGPLPANGAPAGAFSRGSPLREAAVCQIQIMEVGGKQIKKFLPGQQLLQYLRDFFFVCSYSFV